MEMNVATITDAAPGTEIYYLEHIYVVLLLIFILLLVWYIGMKMRSMYRKLSGGDKDDV